jgi:hypothetical protein
MPNNHVCVGFVLLLRERWHARAPIVENREGTTMIRIALAALAASAALLTGTAYAQQQID